MDSWAPTSGSLRGCVICWNSSMNVIERVSKKKKKLIVGLMSGTSADGIDAVLVEVRGSGAKTRVKQLAFASYPFPPPLTRFILRNSDARTARLGDMAVGGTGAPLVPFVDYLLLRSKKEHRALFNIGGIANMTLLPAGGSIEDVIAFDTGPGNMVIDYLARTLYGRSCDIGGRIASRGKLLPSLLGWMAAHPYLRRPPPKSTGRELFGELFAKKLLLRSRGLKRDDIIATASEFTALSIYLSARKFFPHVSFPSEVLVSGGGSKNRYVMDALQRYFAEAKVSTTDATALPARPKEAICFAILANETVAGNPSNVRKRSASPYWPTKPSP